MEAAQCSCKALHSEGIRRAYCSITDKETPQLLTLLKTKIRPSSVSWGYIKRAFDEL